MHHLGRQGRPVSTTEGLHQPSPKSDKVTLVFTVWSPSLKFSLLRLSMSLSLPLYTPNSFTLSLPLFRVLVPRTSLLFLPLLLVYDSFNPLIYLLV